MARRTEERVLELEKRKVNTGICTHAEITVHWARRIFLQLEYISNIFISLGRNFLTHCCSKLGLQNVVSHQMASGFYCKLLYDMFS